MTEIGFNFEGKSDNWIEYYNSIRKLLNNRNSIPIEEIGTNAYSWILRHKKKNEDGKLTQFQSKLITELNLERFFEDWESTFEKISEWVNTHKKIPTRIANKELNTWLLSQRTRYKNGTLSGEQIEKLQSIGFDLQPLGKEKNEKKWIEWFNRLKDYIERTGSYPGPASEKDLYIWVQSQRARKAGNLRRAKPMPKEREDLLNSINFIWVGEGAGGEESWQESFEQFKRHVDESGRLSLPSVINGKRNELYTWWVNQKNSFKKSELSEERIQKFEQINVDLAEYAETIKRDGFTRWANKTYEIAEFIRTNGRLPRASGDVTESRLYGCLNRTKRALQNNELTDKQLNLLKELSIDF